jgi:hypothetical protein
MAESTTAKTPAVKGDNTAAPASGHVAKPERPNDEEYKTNLAKAEKELKAAEEKMVSWYIIQFPMVVRRSISSRNLRFQRLLLTLGAHQTAADMDE